MAVEEAGNWNELKTDEILGTELSGMSLHQQRGWRHSRMHQKRAPCARWVPSYMAPVAERTQCGAEILKDVDGKPIYVQCKGKTPRSGDSLCSIHRRLMNAMCASNGMRVTGSSIADMKVPWTAFQIESCKAPLTVMDSALIHVGDTAPTVADLAIKLSVFDTEDIRKGFTRAFRYTKQ